MAIQSAMVPDVYRLGDNRSTFAAEVPSDLGQIQIIFPTGAVPFVIPGERLRVLDNGRAVRVLMRANPNAANTTLTFELTAENAGPPAADGWTPVGVFDEAQPVALKLWWLVV